MAQAHIWSKLFPQQKQKKLSTERLLEQATAHDSIFTLALEKAAKAVVNLNGAEKVFLENNLIAHIRFMQCPSGWVLESALAVNRIEAQDMESTKKHLKLALEKFQLYEEAVELCSRGKWENWCKGEKKINVKNIKRVNEEVLIQVSKLK